MFSTDDTIAAIASGAGGAARGIVRVSGTHVVDCLARCFTPTDSIDLRAIRRASVVPGSVTLAGLTSKLPCELYLWPDARSYTREPCAELHTFGSPPLLEALVVAICAGGARPARPGEFTLRAFLAGRLDLTQAEAVLGVIDADHDAALRVALDQLAGGLGNRLRAVRDELLDLLAHLEAGLDFVEEDIEFISRAELDRQLSAAERLVADVAARMASRAESGEVPRVVIVGWPNVGKSSLFNALVGTSGAIVSPLSGTTRDYLSASIDLGGFACELIDTAGIETDVARDGISVAAQGATAEQRARADLRVLCLDASRAMNDWEQSELTSQPVETSLIAWTKGDLAASSSPSVSRIVTSSNSGLGLGDLRRAIREALSRTGESVVASTAVRCRETLRSAASSLAHARAVVAAGGGEELAAAEIRVALDALGEVVGAVYTDDILDRIFSRFCIGK